MWYCERDGDTRDGEMEEENSGNGCTVALIALPVELQHLILHECSARTLAKAACCCQAWRVATPLLAVERLRSARFRLDADDIPLTRALRALSGPERLACHLNERPTSKEKGWREEWPSLRMRQAYLLASSKGPERALQFTRQINALGGWEGIKVSFAAGGIYSVDSEICGAYAASIAWKTDRLGWPRARAEEVSLLASRAGAALTSAILTGRNGTAAAAAPEFSASAWTLSAALWERAWRSAAEGRVAPPCYAHLWGEFGLATEDDSWRKLVSKSSTLGDTIVTCGFATAMMANENSFPRPSLGYHMPVVGSQGPTQYELVDSDLVCFLSEPANNGACRSLLAADDAVYRLPPFTEVTLVRVLEPGEWAVHGRWELSERERQVQRRCFEVTVAF